MNIWKHVLSVHRCSECTVKEALHKEEEEEGEEEGEDAAMEVGNVVLLQALSPGRLFPPAPVLLQLSPPSLPHLAYICNFLATPNQ